MPHTSYTVASARQLKGWSKHNQPTGIPSMVEQDILDSTIERITSASIPDDSAYVDTSEQLYFTPILTSSRSAVLSPLLTPEQARNSSPYQFSVSSRSTAPSPHMDVHKDIHITTAQLNQLLIGLARTALIQSCLVGKHLTFKHKAVIKSVPSLYTLDNKRFSDIKTGDSTTDRLPLNSRAGGVSVVDARAEGSPVIYTSAHMVPGVLQVGQHAKLSLSKSTSCKAILHTWEDVDDESTRIILQIINSAIGEPGRGAAYIVAEFDVTKHFIEAVLAELASVHQGSTTAVHNSTSGFVRGKADSTITLDELQNEEDIAGVVTRTLDAYKTLDAETCSMQILRLMTTLWNAIVLHKDVLILKGKKTESGRMQIVFVSEHLSNAMDAMDAAEAKGSVDNTFPRSGPFLRKITSAADPCNRVKDPGIENEAGFCNYIRCVPLFDDTARTATAWAVFVDPQARLVW